jgi:hypothetical protein
MGFAHQLRFSDEDNGETEDISTSTLKQKDIFWIVSYALFLTTAILFMLYNHYWWIPAVAGVLLSQILIIVNWQEAKYGTITNIIILMSIVLIQMLAL